MIVSDFFGLQDNSFLYQLQDLFFDVLLHYYDFPRRAVADLHNIDPRRQCLITDTAACDVIDADGLTLGALDDDAATERVDFRVPCINTSNAFCAVGFEVGNSCVIILSN